MDIHQKHYEDEIDLRDIVKTFLRYKWLILGAAMLFATVTWGVSEFYIPNKYQSKATIMVTQPEPIISLDRPISVLPSIPSMDEMVIMAQSDELLGEIYGSDSERRDTAVSAYKMDREQISLEFTGTDPISTISTVQFADMNKGWIRLEVSGADPDGTAQFANLWAQNFVEWLNREYSINQAVAQLESHVEAARLSWVEAEESLVDELSERQIDVLETKLEQKKNEFKMTLTELDQHDSLISSIQTFDVQLAKGDRNDQLSWGQAVTLLALHQQVVDGPGGAPLLIPASNPILPDNYTINQARDDIRILVSSVQEKNKILESHVSILENEITSLALEFEQIQYDLILLTSERYQWHTTFLPLASRLFDWRYAFAESDQVAEIFIHAQIPERQISPKPFFNATLAGAVGVMLSTFVMFFVEWLRWPENKTETNGISSS